MRTVKVPLLHLTCGLRLTITKCVTPMQMFLYVRASQSLLRKSCNTHFRRSDAHLIDCPLTIKLENMAKRSSKPTTAGGGACEEFCCLLTCTCGDEFNEHSECSVASEGFKNWIINPGFRDPQFVLASCGLDDLTRSSGSP